MGKPGDDEYVDHEPSLDEIFCQFIEKLVWAYSSIINSISFPSRTFLSRLVDRVTGCTRPLQVPRRMHGWTHYEVTLTLNTTIPGFRACCAKSVIARLTRFTTQAFV